MRSASGCCLKPIETGTRMEYPLGGSTWGIPYKIDVCTGCGKEVEEYVLVHGCCGLEICECEVVASA